MAHYPLLLWLSTGASLLGSVQFGYHIGVLNTSEEHVEADLGVGPSAALVAVLLIGATFGSLAAGRAADHLGPRMASIINNGLFLAGTAVSMCAASLASMLAGRAVAGLACGAASVLVPRYLAEIAPLGIRGALGTLTQVFINVGILAAYLIGLPYEGSMHSVDLLGRDVAWWRIMFAAALGPPLLQSATLALCPESPAWLLRAGRPAAAARALQRLHGAAFQPEHYHPKVQAATAAASAAAAAGGHPPSDAELADAEQPLLGGGAGQAGVFEEGEEQAHLGWSALWAPRYRRVMVLAAALPLAQQASGINTVIFFSTKIFQQAGLQSPILGSIAMGLTNLAFTLVAAALMDRTGRRALLLASFAGMAVCLAALSAFMMLPTPQALEGPVSLASVLAYMVFFALGAGPIPYLYLPEVLPTEILGTAQAFCTSLNWLSNLVVGSTFPALLAALGIAGSYIVYAALNVAAFFFLRSRMVETKQQPAEHIRALMLRDGA